MYITTSSPVFPSHYDQDKGSPQWIKRYVKACWDDWHTINCESFYNGRTRYDNIRKYMLGKQSMEKYFELLDVDTANSDKSWLKAVKEPFPIAAKFARMTKSSLMKNGYNITLSGIDRMSIEEKNDYYAQQRSRIELRQMMRDNGLPEDLIEKPDRDFKNTKELDIFMEYGYKSRYEIEGEEIIKLLMNNSGHDYIRQLNIDQLHDYGFVGYKDYVDMNGDIKEAFVDVRDVIVSRCRYPDFRDSFYRGEVKDYTISDIKQLDTKQEISDKVYKELVEKKGKNLGNFYTNQNNNPIDYENERLQVLELEFDATDSYVLVNKKDKNGNDLSYRVKDIYSADKDGVVTTKDYKVKYVAKWIIGTDVYFGCGLQTNMKRARKNIEDVQSCYHFYAPLLDNMETRSMAENYVPIIDTMQIAYMKYQDVIVSAKKRGVMIDVTALENIPIGKGGVAFTPIEQFDFYKKTGSLFFRSVKEDGKLSNATPITELNNGLGDEASRYFNEIQNQVLLLQQISGYNELTDGSTPDERTLKTVAKQAADSTNNSIDFLKKAERNCFESLAMGLLLRVQDAAENGTLVNFVNAIGMDSVRFFEVGADFSSRELGMEVKDEPTDYQKEALQQKIQLAIQTGQITIADSFVIENIKNIKHAEAVLAHRVEQYLEKQQEINLQNQQMNAQVQQESAQIASQLKKEEIGVETQAKIALLEAEKQKELELLDKKYGYEMQLKELEVSGRIEQNRLQADAKTYSSDRQAKSSESIHMATIEKENVHKAVDMEMMEKENKTED